MVQLEDQVERFLPLSCLVSLYIRRGPTPLLSSGSFHPCPLTEPSDRAARCALPLPPWASVLVLVIVKKKTPIASTCVTDDTLKTTSLVTPDMGFLHPAMKGFRVRAQSHETAPCPISDASPKAKLSPGLPTDHLQVRASQTPLCGFDKCGRATQEKFTS